jgi:hypothetical protein
LITAKKNKSDDSWKASLITWFEIIKRLIQDATFIHTDTGHTKIDKFRENEAKTRRSRGSVAKNSK